MNQESGTAAFVDLARLLADAGAGDGPLWTLASEDLNVNLLRFDGGRGVPEHVNEDPYGEGWICLIEPSADG